MTTAAASLEGRDSVSVRTEYTHAETDLFGLELQIPVVLLLILILTKLLLLTLPLSCHY